MAARSRLKELNVSLAVSSSASSVETEKSQEEYTEDFHSSLQSTDEEVSSKSSEICTDYSDDDDVSGLLTSIDECVSQFIDKKLQILKENRVTLREDISNNPSGFQDYRELNHHWLKKLEILRQRNASAQVLRTKYNEQNTNLYQLNSNSKNEKCTNKCNDSKLKRNVNEIGTLQSAYERIKFENLRDKCKKLLESDIHSPEICKKCQKMQEELLKNEFYASCVSNVKQKATEERLTEHLQSTSSALLIAKIIEEGPKPNWTKDEIWDKLLSGGYQHKLNCSEINLE